MQVSELSARLGVRHPIIQGPFGGGLSTPELAAAVSNRGGLGSYGAHCLAPDELLATAARIRALTAEPFALNLWISNDDPGGLDFDAESFAAAVARFAPYFQELDAPLPELPRPEAVGYHYRDQLEALLEARPAVFSFVFGIPSPEVLEACRGRDILTVGAATSIAEARALEEAGVQVIVATGFEAGGHRPSFLARPERSLMGTFALTQLVSTRVRVPVVAAGGIVDERGVRAARALGAHGVQVGTAFLACEESGARPEHRALLLSPRGEHTALTRSFSGRLARGLQNRWLRDWEALPSAPYPLQSYLTKQLALAVGERGGEVAEVASLWGSQVSPNLRHRRAGDVFEALLRWLE